jgi:hypothetical protein
LVQRFGTSEELLENHREAIAAMDFFTVHTISVGVLFEAAPRILIHDRDAKYETEVPAAISSLKINAVRTSFESPWQNGIAERTSICARCSSTGLGLRCCASNAKA